LWVPSSKCYLSVSLCALNVDECIPIEDFWLFKKEIRNWSLEIY
jgi:hypothetical protein